MSLKSAVRSSICAALCLLSNSLLADVRVLVSYDANTYKIEDVISLKKMDLEKTKLIKYRLNARRDNWIKHYSPEQHLKITWRNEVVVIDDPRIVRAPLENSEYPSAHQYVVLEKGSFIIDLPIKKSEIKDLRLVFPQVTSFAK